MCLYAAGMGASAAELPSGVSAAKEAGQFGMPTNGYDVYFIGARPLLVVYGADHVSRTARRDGGPNRNLPFQPTALRLSRRGVKACGVS